MVLRGFGNKPQSSKHFIKNFYGDSGLKNDVQFPEKLHNLFKDSSFFPERMKIENFKICKLK